MNRPHLVLIGGFLGAGKTTAILALARWLADQGIRAGFITNDQGHGLVDTQLLRSFGCTTEEIAGGCFCCRFDELIGATRRLRGVLQPDVLVAEAVGSCTDLAATVSYPMRRLAGDDCTIAPLSVVVDPVRARRAFGLERGEVFSEAVQYIYRKQLEEADLIVINKCETLPTAAIAELRSILGGEFPGARVLAVSAREGINLDDWFQRVVFAEQRSRAVMKVDYDRYADGESRLGWLNATVQATAAVAEDGNLLLEQLALRLRGLLSEHRSPVAHLKMTLHVPAAADAGIASIHLVRNDFAAELGARLAAPIVAGQLIVNLRAEASPAVLEALLHESLAGIGGGWRLDLTHIEAFRPGKPEPSHRDVTLPCS